MKRKIVQIFLYLLAISGTAVTVAAAVLFRGSYVWAGVGEMAGLISLTALAGILDQKFSEYMDTISGPNERGT